MPNLDKYKDPWGGKAWNEEKWIVRFAYNGWKDYICPKCNYTENVDIHVRLDWYYCPACGEKLRDGEHPKFKKIES